MKYLVVIGYEGLCNIYRERERKGERADRIGYIILMVSGISCIILYHIYIYIHIYIYHWFTIYIYIYMIITIYIQQSEIDIDW